MLLASDSQTEDVAGARPPTEGGWSKVDISIIRNSGKIGRSAVCVYLVLLQHADHATGACWPNLDRIAGWTGLSEKSVSREIRTLIRAGLVTKKRTFRGGGGSSNAYTVNRTFGDTRPPKYEQSEEVRPPKYVHQTAQICASDHAPTRANKNQRTRPKNQTQRDARVKDSDVLDNISYPEGMDTPQVRSAVLEWLAYKRERKQTYKNPVVQISKLLKQEHFHGDPSTFVAAVDHSISANYSGCFPPGGNGNGPGRTGQTGKFGRQGGGVGSRNGTRVHERDYSDLDA